MTDLHSAPPETGAAPPARTRPGPEGKGTNPVRLAILAGLVALLGLTGGWPMLVVVAGVVVMIFLHELGHFLAARLGGMKATEFFIGFGPKIWSFQRGETEYGLKAIPAGAYVKVIGMNNLDEVPAGDERYTYRQASYPRRMAVAVAGSAMHFAQALILLFVLHGFVGIPGGIDGEAWRIGDVVEGSAADAAGLQAGDELVALDGTDIATFNEFAAVISSQPGDDVVFTVLRDGVTLDVPATIGVSDTDATVGRLGVTRRSYAETVGPVRAVSQSVSDFGEQVGATVGFLGDFFTPSGIADFAGDVAQANDDSVPVVESSGSPSSAPAAEQPDDGRIMSIVGAVGLGAQLTESGMLGFLVFFVSINVTIGIFNLLPVLPLDGGHVVVATYERIREALRPGRDRYHVDFARLLPAVYTVFVILVMLGVTTIYLDIIDPVNL